MANVESFNVNNTNPITSIRNGSYLCNESKNFKDPIISAASIDWSIGSSAYNEVFKSIIDMLRNDYPDLNIPTVTDMNSVQVLNLIKFILEALHSLKAEPEPEPPYRIYIGTEMPTEVTSDWMPIYQEAPFEMQLGVNFEDGQIFYISYPNNWSLEVLNNDGYTIAPNYLSVNARTQIAGFMINKFTSATSAGSDTSTWTLKFGVVEEEEPGYKIYIGTEMPSEVTADWITIDNDAPFERELGVDFEDGQIFYISFPNEWSLEVLNNDGYTIAPNYLSVNARTQIAEYMINKFTSATSAGSNTSTWKLIFTK